LTGTSEFPDPGWIILAPEEVARLWKHRMRTTSSTSQYHSKGRWFSPHTTSNHSSQYSALCFQRGLLVLLIVPPCWKDCWQQSTSTDCTSSVVAHSIPSTCTNYLYNSSNDIYCSLMLLEYYILLLYSIHSGVRRLECVTPTAFHTKTSQQSGSSSVYYCTLYVNWGKSKGRRLVGTRNKIGNIASEAINPASKCSLCWSKIVFYSLSFTLRSNNYFRVTQTRRNIIGLVGPCPG
jgi:hypothetical protein